MQCKHWKTTMRRHESAACLPFCSFIRSFVHLFSYGIAQRRIYIPALLFVVVVVKVWFICCLLLFVAFATRFAANPSLAGEKAQEEEELYIEQQFWVGLEICLLIFPQCAPKNMLICCNFCTTIWIAGRCVCLCFRFQLDTRHNFDFIFYTFTESDFYLSVRFEMPSWMRFFLLTHKHTHTHCLCMIWPTQSAHHYHYLSDISAFRNVSAVAIAVCCWLLILYFTPSHHPTSFHLLLSIGALCVSGNSIENSITQTVCLFIYLWLLVEGLIAAYGGHYHPLLLSSLLSSYCLLQRSFFMHYTRIDHHHHHQYFGFQFIWLAFHQHFLNFIWICIKAYHLLLLLMHEVCLNWHDISNELLWMAWPSVWPSKMIDFTGTNLGNCLICSTFWLLLNVNHIKHFPINALLLHTKRYTEVYAFCGMLAEEDEKENPKMKCWYRNLVWRKLIFVNFRNKFTHWLQTKPLHDKCPCPIFTSLFDGMHNQVARKKTTRRSCCMQNNSDRAAEKRIDEERDGSWEKKNFSCKWRNHRKERKKHGSVVDVCVF